MGLREAGLETWTVLMWLRIGTVAGICKSDNETTGSIKFGEFIE